MNACNPFHRGRAGAPRRRLVTVLALAVALLAATLLPLQARAQTWASVGPPGGSVRGMASDPARPGRLYLGTADGVLYRSDDQGDHWRRLTPGFPLRGRSLDAIAIGRGGAVYVGYWEVQGSGGGVARSTDGGRTFKVLEGVSGESVRALAIAPTNPLVLAAGTLTGVFLTHDGGRTWRRITPTGDADLKNVESVAFDPTDAHVLYAGTWHLAWKTSDDGAMWRPIHHGMVDDSDVMSLTPAPDDPQTVYATACTGIYRSRLGGNGWTKLVGIPEANRRTRCFAMSDDGDLLLAGTTTGLWISENGGAAWRCTTPRELVVNAVLLQPDGTILLGTEDAGVLRSPDRGRTWSPSNAGFSERLVSSILFDPRGGRVLVAAWGDPRYGGVFAAKSVRGPWAAFGRGMEGRQVLSLAALGDTVLAGTDDGIFARGPANGAWVRLPTRLESGDIHPHVTELVVTGSGRLLAATRQGMLRSADGGRTWTRPTLGNAPEIWAIAPSPQEPELAVAATPAGVFRSHDSGASWNRVSQDLGRVTVHRLLFSRADDEALVATTSGGLFRSIDQGGSWTRAGGGIPESDLTGIAMDDRGRVVYASDFTLGGIFRSTNGGRTWKRLPVDGLATDRVWTLSMDPSAPDQLLVAPASGGLQLLVAPPFSVGDAEPEQSEEPAASGTRSATSP